MIRFGKLEEKKERKWVRERKKGEIEKEKEGDRGTDIFKKVLNV